MQRDSIPSEVDYETRQGVYSICLQLARYLSSIHGKLHWHDFMKYLLVSVSVSLHRFLLVGQTMPSILDEELGKEGVDTLSSRPFRNAGRQSGRQLSLCGTPEKSSYRQMSMSDRSSIRVEEIIPAARVAIQVCTHLRGLADTLLTRDLKKIGLIFCCLMSVLFLIVAVAKDNGGGRLHFYSGLLHAPHLGCSCWSIGPCG